jgi:aromatic-L-amino-acid/L-tryptophan decarboxylase
MSLPSLEALRLACAHPPEHPSADATRTAGRDVMDAMLDDFLGLGDGGIGLTASPPELENLLRETPPEEGMNLAHLLDEFRAKIVRHSFRPNHPRFCAFIPGAPSFASILGDCLATSTNLFAGVWKEAAGPTQVEIMVLDWFKQFLGYPASASGLLTSGGSEANLTALIVAREKIPFAGRSRIVLYASEHRHWSIDRAAKIIGLAPEQIRPLACDADFRLKVDALERAIEEDERAGRLPWLVIATAGTTNTGSIDPLAEVADIAAERRLWLHVDAAYGWPMALTDEGRKLLCGIERADSITLDPHKWFAQPFEAGCLLVRQGDLLARTFAMRPEYMQDVIPKHDEVNFCDHGLALTRRFRALKIWFSIKLLGLAWHRRLIEHCCALATYAQALLADSPCFEITSPHKLGVVCFRFEPDAPARDRASPLASASGSDDALQQAIAAELLRTGRAFLSTTRLHGRTTLRFCFVNWRTTAADVEEIVRLVQEIGAKTAPDA